MDMAVAVGHGFVGDKLPKNFVVMLALCQRTLIVALRHARIVLPNIPLMCVFGGSRTDAKKSQKLVILYAHRNAVHGVGEMPGVSVALLLLRTAAR